MEKKLVVGQTLSQKWRRNWLVVKHFHDHIFYTTLHTTSLPNTFTKVKKKLVGGQTLSRSHFYTTLHTTSLPNQLLKHFWKQFPHMGKPFWNTYLNKLHFFVLWCTTHAHTHTPAPSRRMGGLDPRNTRPPPTHTHQRMNERRLWICFKNSNKNRNLTTKTDTQFFCQINLLFQTGFLWCV